ncbi:MAG: HemK2/MTQ2 family protein methyltransferase [Thermoplasmata archaeon]
MELDPAIHVKEDNQVYRPAEDSYLLLRAIDIAQTSSFLEIGTGTGLIALHAARAVRTVATDISPFAVSLARANAQRNGLPLHVIRADLFQGLHGSFDVIAFNPPYLPLNPRGEWLDHAWSGGMGGDEVVLRFLRDAPGYLAEGGVMYLLLSAQNREGLRVARTAFKTEELATEALFFEDITVYGLRLRSDRGNPNPRSNL